MQNAKIGGILSIVSGAIGLLRGLFIAGLGVFFSVLMPFTTALSKGSQAEPFAPQVVFIIIAIIYGVIGLCMLLIGALAIVGGYFAIIKKRFWWAIAGSIAAAYTFFPGGIAAVLLIALGRNEFQSPASKEESLKVMTK